jgi:hypothetical protein
MRADEVEGEHRQNDEEEERLLVAYCNLDEQGLSFSLLLPPCLKIHINIFE